VLANETVAGRTLIEAIQEQAQHGPIRVTVISPQNDPRAGYVVYEDSRRSSAERRLRQTLDLLHEAGIAARGAVVDPDPLQALRDALHQYAPVDQIIISTHPGAVRSSWLRAGLVDRALAELREAGVEATGHIGDPDPVTAAMNAVHDEQVDEIVVSTFPEASSGWLRRDVVGRIEKGAELPVRHVVVEESEAEVAS
jgi:hypothetical protein